MSSLHFNLIIFLQSNVKRGPLEAKQKFRKLDCHLNAWSPSKSIMMTQTLSSYRLDGLQSSKPHAGFNHQLSLRPQLSLPGKTYLSDLYQKGVPRSPGGPLQANFWNFRKKVESARTMCACKIFPPVKIDTSKCIDYVRHIGHTHWDRYSWCPRPFLKCTLHLLA